MSFSPTCPRCGTTLFTESCINPLCEKADEVDRNAAEVITDLQSRLAEATARNTQILRDFHAEIHDGQSESAHDVIQRLVREKQEAQARAERAEAMWNRAVSLLKEIFAEVNGEAPRLLDDDCGGNGRLYLEIKELLLTPAPQGRTDGERDERARFEKWAEAYGMNISRSVIEKDSYSWSNTRDAWTGWLAAMDATAPEVKGGRSMIIEELAKLGDEELRVRCAELCGVQTRYFKFWYQHEEGHDEASGMRTFAEAEAERKSLDGDPVEEYTAFGLFPNYPADLNAMHEAEKTLGKEDVRHFHSALLNLVGDSAPSLTDCKNGKPWAERWSWHATARQRCIAFIAVKQQPTDEQAGKEGVST